jgi:hypothetical protein
MPADTPTIVFVHGAWADATGSCWAPRTEPFRRRGNDSWPSGETRGSRRWQRRTRPWCRSRRP